jgi:hypothetical protein
LGDVLRYQGDRSERVQASLFYSQAQSAYENALAILTERDFPSAWVQTMQNVARTSEAEKLWQQSLQTYQALLRHDPGNLVWQAKVKELEQKN